MSTPSRSLWAVLIAVFAIVPVAGHSQDKEQFRNEAKTAEAQLRELGEPKDRCSIGAFVADGSIVSRTFAATSLMPGDRLLTINQVDVSGKSSQHVIALLRAIEPTAVIPITVDRAGKVLSLEVSCSNAKAGTDAQLAGLSLASRGKFDECVSVFSQRNDFGSQGAIMKVQCATFSRNSKTYDLPALTVEALRMMIEDARWVPAVRPEVIQRLRAVDGMITQKLGPFHFEELVAATKTWPGGEELFDSSAPDWASFRRNSEAALRTRLIDPESARIEWPYGFLLGSWRPFLSKRIDGYWTCGSINARNRMGGYTGSTSFVVVLDPNGAVKYVELGEQKDFDLLTSQCNNSAGLLPPAPLEPVVGTSAQSVPSASIADELKKLVDLKNSGSLTEAEFQAAKQRLLGMPDKK